VFTAVDAVLLRPLGYAHPERLVSVYSRHPRQGDFYPPSYPDFRDWRDAAGEAVEGMAFVRGETLLLRGSEGARPITGAHVSESFFRVMGARPLLGREFAPDEERPGGPRVLVLKYAAWQREFGGDPAVVGRTLDFAEGPYTVIGVMPPGFTYPGWGDAYAPLATLPHRRESLEARAYRVDNRVVARLRPGVAEARAAAQLDAVARRLAAAYPAENAGWGAQVVSLREETVGGVRTSLLVFLGAVGLVLLIACADVANLLLVRATARAREVAVRAALGASRWRIARQLLAESLVLAAAGGALGALLAVWGVHLLKAAAPPDLPRLDEVGVDAAALAFTGFVSVATALAFGAVPALHASRVDLHEAMREGSRGAGQGARGLRLRSALVVAQVALAVVLLVGAGVLLRSFAKLRDVSPGFDPAPLLAVRVEPPAARYDTPEKLAGLYGRLEEAVGAVPGVQRVAFINHLPLVGAGIPTPVVAEGQTRQPDSAAVTLFRVVDAGYFAALGQPVVRGRALAPADMGTSSTALVVNETFVRQYWGTADPVGRRVGVRKQAGGFPDYGAPIGGQVVGVVRDVAFRQLGDPPLPEVYVPMPVNPWRWGFLVVRAHGDPAALTGAVRRAVASVDRDVAIVRAVPVSTLLAETFTARRFSTTLLTAFAAAALVLAAVGVYGVISYAVAMRTHEIGVRTALGAQRRDVIALIVGAGAKLALAGVVVGLTLAAAVTRVLEGMVYGVGVRDAATFAAGGLLLAGVAVAASCVPAMRAARVDPVRALRAE
jgi:predicted permease